MVGESANELGMNREVAMKRGGSDEDIHPSSFRPSSLQLALHRRQELCVRFRFFQTLEHDFHLLNGR